MVWLQKLERKSGSGGVVYWRDPAALTHGLDLRASRVAKPWQGTRG